MYNLVAMDDIKIIIIFIQKIIIENLLQLYHYDYSVYEPEIYFLFLEG